MRTTPYIRTYRKGPGQVRRILAACALANWLGDRGLPRGKVDRPALLQRLAAAIRDRVSSSGWSPADVVIYYNLPASLVVEVLKTGSFGPALTEGMVWRSARDRSLRWGAGVLDEDPEILLDSTQKT